MNHEERMQKISEINAAVDRLTSQRDAALSSVDSQLEELHSKVVNAANDGDANAPPSSDAATEHVV